MEGRDIGSPGHHRAAVIVAQRFKVAGLKPAGDNGTYFQTFPVHESRVETAGTSFSVADGPTGALSFLKQTHCGPPTSSPPCSTGG